jgi:hypothetical protein
MELGGALGSFVTWAVGWLARFGAVAATLWAAWTMVKVLLHGGKGRAVWELVIGLAVIVVVHAALKDLPGTLALASGLGQQAWASISAELRAGLS